ncbi:MAG: hypothetical protein EOP10_15900 [Proteobacteria bacterium]|nr:MAG: hypothetical protein EOP10_15900 [Pseudomonadota bacterium]
MISRAAILALGSLFLFSACGKSKRKAPEVQYFVHGNPLSLVSGTQKSPSFLTPETAQTFNGFHYSGGSSFVERDKLQPPSSWTQVEADNSTEASDTEIASEFDLVPYAFRQESATRWVWGPSAGKGYQFGFSVVDGKLNLTDFAGFPVIGEHYSLKDDGRAFSLLFSTADNASGRILAAFYFAASDTVNPIRNASKDFAFLIDTVKLPWTSNIAVDTCGTYSATVESTIQKSIDAWMVDDAPTATRRPVSHTTRIAYPPFSDLNIHCILPVSNFKLESSYDFYVAGVTIPVYNLASKEMIDSDIMLFTDQRAVAAQLLSGEKSSTLTHELGHFFGLGHEFKRDEAGAALHPSIMGYSQGASIVTSWDFEAIRDLYGESFGPAAP